jgi:hypothetical protein
MKLEVITPRWAGQTVIVAAPGPSLTLDVAAACNTARPVLAVGDAWRRLPWAEVLYHCDAAWWRHHKGVPDFNGERWSSHDAGINDKCDVAARYPVRLVAGRAGSTFSRDPQRIHYGKNSGFQAINLAILFGARRIILVGFDMQERDGQRHFFGPHPKPLRNGATYRSWVPMFRNAARHLEDVEIVNATPGSALDCWPVMTIEDALAKWPQARRSRDSFVNDHTGEYGVTAEQ